MKGWRNIPRKEDFGLSVSPRSVRKSCPAQASVARRLIIRISFASSWMCAMLFVFKQVVLLRKFNEKYARMMCI